MLTLIYGNDTLKKNRTRDTAVRGFDRSQIVTRTDMDASAEELGMLARGGSLFDTAIAAVYFGALENEAFREYALSDLATLAESKNRFVFIEQGVNKETERAFSEAGADVVECKAAAMKKSAPTTFALADAFATRDRKKAWTLYQKEVENETAPEEILGVLWWVVKNMLIVKAGPRPSEKDSGLSSFVYAKAVTQSQNYSQEELEALGASLVRLGHDGHAGLVDMREGLELFLLGEHSAA